MSIREKLEALSENELEQLISEDHELCNEFTAMTEAEIVDQSRWSTHYRQVFKHVDDSFWRFSWSRGSTEYQDNGPENIFIEQVYPKEVTVIKYVTKPPKN